MCSFASICLLLKAARRIGNIAISARNIHILINENEHTEYIILYLLKHTQ